MSRLPTCICGRAGVAVGHAVGRDTGAVGRAVAGCVAVGNAGAVGVAMGEGVLVTVGAKVGIAASVIADNAGKDKVALAVGASCRQPAKSSARSNGEFSRTRIMHLPVVVFLTGSIRRPLYIHTDIYNLTNLEMPSQ